MIAPFNFPLILSIRSVAPALALGNVVLLKPVLCWVTVLLEGSTWWRSARPASPCALTRFDLAAYRISDWTPR